MNYYAISNHLDGIFPSSVQGRVGLRVFISLTLSLSFRRLPLHSLRSSLLNFVIVWH